MKVIVCYGDSNTWGFKPEKIQPMAGFNRFSYEERWPGILQRLLGTDYRVEEEGLSGRTTAFDDPFNPNLNGAKYFDCCMMINAPVDLLIIALGTNDTKEFFSVNAYCIARGLEQLILKARAGQYGPKGENPKILIISPQPLRNNITQTWPAEIFGRGCLEKARAIPIEYRKIAKKYQCRFLDMTRLVENSELDGVHLDASNHEKFALEVYKKVSEIFDGIVEETNE